MTKYDGWTLKVIGKKSESLCLGFCHDTRKEVIEHIEKLIPEPWKKRRLKLTHKIVKVKLVEVK